MVITPPAVESGALIAVAGTGSHNEQSAITHVLPRLLCYLRESNRHSYGPRLPEELMRGLFPDHGAG